MSNQFGNDVTSKGGNLRGKINSFLDFATICNHVKLKAGSIRIKIVRLIKNYLRTDITTTKITLILSFILMRIMLK